MSVLYLNVPITAILQRAKEEHSFSHTKHLSDKQM